MTVDHVDILSDEISPHHYKASEDLSMFKSTRTNRGPLQEGWKENSNPIMCSYKAVEAKLEIWGLQGKAEETIHKVEKPQDSHDPLDWPHSPGLQWLGLITDGRTACVKIVITIPAVIVVGLVDQKTLSLFVINIDPLGPFTVHGR